MHVLLMASPICDEKLSNFITQVEKYMTKTKQFLSISFLEHQEALALSPSWLSGICSMIRTRAEKQPPLQNTPAKLTPCFQTLQEVGSFTAATYSDIFQTFLTASVCIRVTIYRREKRHVSILKGFLGSSEPALVHCFAHSGRASGDTA